MVSLRWSLIISARHQQQKGQAQANKGRRTLPNAHPVGTYTHMARRLAWSSTDTPHGTSMLANCHEDRADNDTIAQGR